MAGDVVAHLLEQLTFYWEAQARPRLDGLTDDEYFWEPAANCWNLVPRAQARTETRAGVGDLVAEFADPEPDPAPVTTIAWRMGHLMLGVFGMRAASHFGGPAVSYDTVVWPATALEAVGALEEAYGRWIAGVAALDADTLWKPVGPAEGPFADAPMIDLVLHIHREAIHHLSEIALLRDLYRARS